ncbi:MAG: endolytic peptidoglycan transglycosylase RlpA [Enterobacteriaceae bacterium]
MRKEWLWSLSVIFLLTGCPTTTERQQPTVYSGPTETITGVEPKYEPYSPVANHDYTMNGSEYHIITDPQNYSKRGLASEYSATRQGQKTATGEAFDPGALAAAHPTLPIPSYVRITNLNNNRRLVVRINDRGPFVKDRIIELTPAVVERLNMTAQTPIQVDFIAVAPDGTLSGPGTVGTEFAKQNFALPSRPDIEMAAPPPAQTEAAQTEATTPAASQFKEASKPKGEYDQFRLPQESPASQPPATPAQKPVTAPTQTTSSGTGVMLQVGALSDQARADQWQKTLSQQFATPGRVVSQDNIYRVQLGPFTSREQASTLKEKLEQAQISSFIVEQ